VSKVGILLGGGALALLVGTGMAVSRAAQGPAPGSPPSAAPADGGTPGGLSPKVRVVFQTVPPEKATVMWGKKPLGQIRGKGKPLIVERPRDSGPLDVVVRAKGFLPVRTRAHTFTDNRIDVKLTKLEEKNTLFGYRQELPDAGAPEAGAAMGPPLPAERDAGAPDR
jgi:hypothetical protein